MHKSVCDSVIRTQVQEFKKGDKVRIREDAAEVKILNCRVGWKGEMDEVSVFLLF